MPALPANPYIAEGQQRDDFRTLIRSLLRLTSMTMVSEETVTVDYMVLTLLHAQLFTEGDPVTGHYAAVWEMAALMQETYGADKPIDVKSGTPSCDHDTCKVNHQAEAALIESAIRGDGEAVQGVCAAAVKEGRRLAAQTGDDGYTNEEAVSQLFVATFRRFLHFMAQCIMEGRFNPESK